MIKIEITDPQRENPDVLVKLAGFLMECAGHTMVKAPLETPTAEDLGKYSELFNPIPEGFRHLNTTLNVNEIPEPAGHGVASAPYQHCGSSQAYGDLNTVPVSAMDMPTNFNEVSTAALKEAFSNTVNAGIRALEEPLQVCDDKGSIEPNGLELPPHNHIVAEKPKSESKKKRTPSKPKIEIIKETGVTEISEDLVPSPPVPAFAPPPPVNGNTLVDKIVMAKATNKLTHDEVTAIVKKHGLVAIKDIFTNDHLIPLIDADLDEALRGK